MVLAPEKPVAPIVLRPPIALTYITYCPPILGFEKLIAVISALSVAVKIPVERLLKLMVKVPPEKAFEPKLSGRVNCFENVTAGKIEILLVLVVVAVSKVWPGPVAATKVGKNVPGEASVIAIAVEFELVGPVAPVAPVAPIGPTPPL